MTRPDARAERPRREVVSFVRRSTRMNPSQQRAWEARGRWLVEVPRRETSTSVAPARVDWAAIFGRTAPLVVEIGSGTGDSLVAMAAADGERDHVAFEVFTPAMASTIIKIQQAGIDNVRLVDADGVQGLRELFGTAALAELWTFFPDPWHKARHHKRRLVSPGLADLVADRLAPGAVWRIATDWAEYAEHCRGVLDPHPLLADAYPGGSAPRPSTRPLTRYEHRGLRAGRDVVDLVYRRVEP